MLSAIRFTPVLGPKILGVDHAIRLLMTKGLMQFAENCANDKSILSCLISSLHVLFLDEFDQKALLEKKQVLEMDSRHCVQFHWHNTNPKNGGLYSNFEDYLNSLNHKKRKNIRSERRKVHEQGIEIARLTGSQITQAHIDFFYSCYFQTYLEHFSKPYLSLKFFYQLLETMGEQLVLVQASLDDEPIASAFFLFNNDRLYGRYWGAIRHIDCLHFELCYYQGIEFAIEKRICHFEGGAQGEHKMARGLNPVTMTSAHWIAEPVFKNSIRHFLKHEKEHLKLYASELSEHLAFKKKQESTEFFLDKT